MLTGPVPSRDVRTWRRELPHWVIPVATAATVVAVFVMASMEPSEPIGSPGEYVASIPTVAEGIYNFVFGALIVPAFAAFLAPRLALWTQCALLALLLPVEDETEAITALLVLLLALGLTDVALRHRRRSLVESWTAGVPDVVPVVEPPENDRMYRHTRRERSALLACVLVVALSIGWSWKDHWDAEAFRATARETTVVVEATTEYDDSVVTIDGREYVVPEPSGSRAVGDEIPVLYDPASGRAEDVLDPFDPWLVWTWAGMAGWVVLAIELRVRGRRRRVSRLLRDGGRPLRMTATTRSSGIQLASTDPGISSLGTWHPVAPTRPRNVDVLALEVAALSDLDVHAAIGTYLTRHGYRDLTLQRLGGAPHPPIDGTVSVIGLKDPDVVAVHSDSAPGLWTLLTRSPARRTTAPYEQPVVEDLVPGDPDDDPIEDHCDECVDEEHPCEDCEDWAAGASGMEPAQSGPGPVRRAWMKAGVWVPWVVVAGTLTVAITMGDPSVTRFPAFIAAVWSWSSSPEILRGRRFFALQRGLTMRAFPWPALLSVLEDDRWVAMRIARDDVPGGQQVIVLTTPRTGRRGTSLVSDGAPPREVAARLRAQIPTVPGGYEHTGFLLPSIPLMVGLCGMAAVFIS